MNMDMKRVWSVLCAVVVGLAVTACNDEETASERLLNEINSIDTYLAGKNITPVKDLNGVRMVISKLGKGYPAKILSPTVSSSIDANYVGRIFPDGAQFDAGRVTGALNGYINGWKIAFTTLPEGSKARLYIPSSYGYGTAGSGSIPGNSILEFDVTFNAVSRTSAELQRLSADTVAIDGYLDAKAIAAQKDSTGFRYVVTQEGTGPVPGLYQPVSVNITYKLLTDDTKIITQFDTAPNSQTLNRPVDFLPDALKGVLTKLKAGSNATIYAPSMLAFGAPGATDGTNTIPANSNLIIEIKDLQLVDQ
jgi:FKBP-type peptidyl-prolyl cis-trans isomerase FkpA